LARHDVRIEDATVALAHAMSDRDTELRARAARCLGSIGPAAADALPHLRAALTDPEPEVRREAAKALWLVGEDRSGVAVLVRDLAGGSRWGTRRFAATTLGDMGEAGAEGLGEVLMRREEPERWRLARDERYPQTPQDEAVRELSEMGKAGAAQLARGLRHPQVEVRRKAAYALSEMGHAASAALDGLGAALSDDDARVRGAAAEALSCLGADVKGVIAQLLAARGAEDMRTRWFVARALAKCGDATRPVVDALRDSLDDPSCLVRVEAAGGLCLRAPDDAAVRVLVGSVQAGRPIPLGEAFGAQWQALWYLARIRGQEETVVRSLAAAARHGNDELLEIDEYVFEAMGERAAAIFPLLEAAARAGVRSAREWGRRALQLAHR
jgi:HEAT repeat protein